MSFGDMFAVSSGSVLKILGSLLAVAVFVVSVLGGCWNPSADEYDGGDWVDTPSSDREDGLDEA